MSERPPKVYVVVLNWNGWKDTIECLESVFKSDYENFGVVVCDNGSDDDSISHIVRWAAGEEACQAGSDDARVAGLSMPPVEKPIATIVQHTREPPSSSLDSALRPKLVIIDCGANKGYAAGNNEGLRFALRQGDFDYGWVLNNDTVVEPDAMRHLVRKMESNRDIGLCGARLIEYHHPDRVQGFGGFVYNSWFAQFRLIEPRAFPALADAPAVESKMFGVQGASVFVSARFLREVGLMCEDYFLYFEEQDWAMRARGRFRLGYVPEAVVFHKGGSATAGDRGLSVYRYLVRSRLIFTRKFFRYALPTVYLRLLAEAIKRLLKGEWGRFRIIMASLLHD